MRIHVSAVQKRGGEIGVWAFDKSTGCALTQRRELDPACCNEAKRSFAPLRIDVKRLRLPSWDAALKAAALHLSLVGYGFFCAQACVGADLKFYELFFACCVAFAQQRSDDCAQKSDWDA